MILQGVPEAYIIQMMLEIRKHEDSGIDFRLSKGYALSDGKRDFSSIFKEADKMLYADKLSKTAHT